MTKEQLLAANERLGAEVAAHRALLAAIRELAAVPRPARWNDVEYVVALESRLGKLKVYAGHVDVRPDIIARVLHDRAQDLREAAAQPVRYAVRDAEPAAAPEKPVYRLTCGCTDGTCACPECRAGRIHGDGTPWHCDEHGSVAINGTAAPERETAASVAL